MTKHEETPIIPPEGEPTEPAAPTDAEPPPPEESVIDAKEAARRRSKEDLARKRRGLHGSRGKR